MSQRLVLVTGISGFIAGHVALQLIEQGYRVRGTARASKLDRYDAVDIPGFEVTEVNDLANDDLTSALKDVDIVMHIAAPLPGKDSVEGTISAAVEGTLNIVRQAEKAGITKIIVTATFGNVLDPSQAPAFTGATFTDSDWGHTTTEKIRQRPDDYFHIYFASKNLAEKALWDFAKSHPHLDITTILPGFVYGPFVKGLPAPTGTHELGSNLWAYVLINGGAPGPYVAPPWIVDVRDVARAHVLALSLPRTLSSSNSSSNSNSNANSTTVTPNLKRFLVNAGNLTWGDAAEHLRTTVPGATIAPLENFVALPGPASSLDTTRAREVLGLTAFIDPRKTMEDVAVDMLRLQKTWHAAQPRN